MVWSIRTWRGTSASSWPKPYSKPPIFICQPPEKERMALFCQNIQLCKITEDLVFTDPYCEAPLNRHTTPHLDENALSFQNDGPLKCAAQELKYAFLTHAEAMVHGDLHTGSVMVTETDTRVIDPEFAFYGPMGFDMELPSLPTCCWLRAPLGP